MKSRLGASLSPLFTGQLRTYISRTISAAKPWLTLFNGDAHANRTLAGLQVQGVNSQIRPLHSSVNDEDDFSELGAPVTQGAGKLLKLVTQKPEPYGKKNHFSGRFFPAETSSSANKLNRAEASQAVLKHENKKGDSRFEVNTKNTSRVTKSTSGSIEDLPSTVDFFQLIEATSALGQTSGASMRTAPNGIEFQSVESRRRAVSVGGIPAKTTRPLHVPETLAIKITNICNETADAAIHSLCMSVGSLEGMARTKENVVDAVYNVKDDLEAQNILKKLNDTIADGYRWSAQLSARDSKNNEDAKCKLGSQISSQLAELKRQVHMKKIDVEDLEYLHWSIVHLQETPGIS